MKRSFHEYVYQSNSASSLLAEKSGNKWRVKNFEFQWHLKGLTKLSL